jgi:hypothetical protein
MAPGTAAGARVVAAAVVDSAAAVVADRLDDERGMVLATGDSSLS